MNILTNWLRHYLPTLPVTDRQLADDLTLRGIAVEGVHSPGPGNGHLFEMDITTNRVDAMNHYGIAREAATIYNLPLTPLILATDPSFRPKRSAVEKPATHTATRYPVPQTHFLRLSPKSTGEGGPLKRQGPSPKAFREQSTTAVSGIALKYKRQECP